MSIHISLLESHDNNARIVLHITFMRTIVFEKEFSMNVGQTFNLNDVSVNEVSFEKNRYDIEFSSN